MIARRAFRFLAAAYVCIPLWADAAWRLTRTEHFELYTQAGDSLTRPLLSWFEQLRAFFLAQPVIPLDRLPPVRLIVFASEKEYEPFRVKASADAYYAGTESRHYIAMPAGWGQLRIAAHEFAHFALHASGLKLPPWLNEGLAEFFSTVRTRESGCELGGDIPAHSQLLRRRTWMPLSELLELAAGAPVRENRDGASLFYAQSWALAEMLALSPEYAPRFPQLLDAIGRQDTSLRVLTSVYGRSLDELEKDLRAWTNRRGPHLMVVAGVTSSAAPAEVSDVPVSASRAVLADLLASGGELGRAETLYRELAREAPGDAGIAAALGAVALRKGNLELARAEWKRAIELGVADADVCYGYAVLADAAGLSADDIRPALERAVALRADFDDARYKLALLEKNTGHVEAAVEHLAAMRNVAPARAFNYWSTLADAFNDLQQREQAVAAAWRAAQYAATPSERTRAAELAYFAQTDLTVQLARDENGRAQMITTRVPHGDPDWNPFVEAGDDLRRIAGTLREIDCSGPATQIRVELPGRLLTLEIADPSRVRMRNAPEELVCGEQEGVAVTVEFAAATDGAAVNGVLRGLTFTKP